MGKAGRPSYLEQDKELLVYMARLWAAGACSYSTRKLSHMAVGLKPVSKNPNVHETCPRDSDFNLESASFRNTTIEAAGGGNLGSKAKRLARHFEKMKNDGSALSISIYEMFHEEIICGRQSSDSIGSKSRSNSVAVVANRCNLSKDIVLSEAQKGLKLLKEWLPDDYRGHQI